MTSGSARAHTMDELFGEAVGVLDNAVRAIDLLRQACTAAATSPAREAAGWNEATSELAETTDRLLEAREAVRRLREAMPS